MAMTNPLQYVQQVRSEVAKVVWPTRREVMLTTIMVGGDIRVECGSFKTT